MDDNQNSRFNRILLIVLALFYVLTITVFIYFNWATEPSFTEWWMIAVNIPILSIPLVLLYGSIYVLVVAWRARAAGGALHPRLAKIIHWAPRIAAILIILFISLFSLDVFESGAPPLEVLVGLLIHNIPSLAMLVLLIFAWKRPVVGFVAFLIAAILFAAFFMRSIYSLSNLVLFILPLLLIASLFYADWKWLQPAPPTQVDAAA